MDGVGGGSGGKGCDGEVRAGGVISRVKGSGGGTVEPLVSETWRNGEVGGENVRGLLGQW